ncbi:hypothetical protein NO2_0903 [Candidatus Termititenax persephonae]|uniref:Response regulatory domain-containing protein n=1 Tax=Candidatus Termititenax persephonae TaxID=2218525 RepID=A0A388THJ2_9BACT|nr:hypothetical protein NO2_0903 [Candidatus Termititenax persephonae]
MTSILVVEDDLNIQKLFAKILEKFLGYTIYTADNGRAALDFYRQNAAKIDLIITDAFMPELSGLELCRQLHKQVPVVITSAFSDARHLAEFKEAGALDFLAKPYDDFDALKTKLAAIQQKIGQ